METIKFCAVCQIDHEITNDFWFFFTRPDGKQGMQCKKNKQEKNKRYAEVNKGKLAAKQKERYHANSSSPEVLEKRKKFRESKKSYMAEYRKNNKEKIKNLCKNWRLENKEYVKEKHNEYMKLHPRDTTDENYKQRANERYRKRYQQDKEFKIKTNLRNRLRQAIGSKSKIGSAVKELGGVQEAIAHLESKFHPNPITGEPMSWENHGVNGWHIDHIIPLSSFDFLNPEDLKKALYYTNLQPLWSKINLTKENFTQNPFNLKIFLEEMGYAPQKTIHDSYFITNGALTLFVRHLDLSISQKDPLELRKECESSNQRVLQFYTPEFIKKPEIIKSMILNFFGQSKRISARDCRVEILKKNKASAPFLNENHLMGNHPTATPVGLYYGNELLAVLSYKKNKTGLEISRFATKNGYMIRGGFSKLLSFIERQKKPEFIVSYCDMRYASGKNYMANGFEVENETQSFSWTNGYSIFNRLTCKANMDERKLTEKEYAKEKGLRRILDAGQSKYIKKIKSL